jgi:carbon storage regulator CsrA
MGLVISRGVGESFVVAVPVGTELPVEVTVEVLEHQRGRVRLRIVAPEDVRVLRSELLPERCDDEQPK